MICTTAYMVHRAGALPSPRLSCRGGRLVCRDPKPWAWNVVDSAKWSSWAQLGKMSCVEAMRLFVKVIEDEQVGPLDGCIGECHACQRPWLRASVSSGVDQWPCNWGGL